MSVNTLNFEQISTVLTSIVQQATGQAVEAPTDTASFVSVAQVALRADRDSVMNAISNILARTIFSIRPYSAKMTGLDMDTFRWGGMMRKLSIADEAWQDDPAFKYPVLFDSTRIPRPVTVVRSIPGRSKSRISCRRIFTVSLSIMTP